MSFELQIESELAQRMRRIAVPYRTALQILRAHNSAGQMGTEDTNGFGRETDVVHRLQPSMAMIADYEEQLAPLREKWRLMKRQPGNELKTLIAEQTEMLRELIELVNQVESHATQAQMQLEGRVDVSAQRIEMRQAYRQKTL